MAGVRIGVSDLFAFKLDETTDSRESKTPPKYEEPFRIAKAIQVGLTPQKAEASLYADDGLDEYASGMTAYDISINVNKLEPLVEGKLLGKTIDSKGGVATSTSDNPPLFAVAFRSKKSDGTYQYRVMYKVRFSVPDEQFNTQGENIEFQTPTITGRAAARDYDGRFDYKLDESDKNKDVVEKWFKEVVEPAAGEKPTPKPTPTPKPEPTPTPENK